MRSLLQPLSWGKTRKRPDRVVVPESVLERYRVCVGRERVCVCVWVGGSLLVSMTVQVMWLTACSAHPSYTSHTHALTHSLYDRLQAFRYLLCWSEYSCFSSHAFQRTGPVAWSFQQQPDSVSDVLLLLSSMWIRSERMTNKTGIGSLGLKDFHS